MEMNIISRLRAQFTTELLQAYGSMTIHFSFKSYSIEPEQCVMVNKVLNMQLYEKKMRINK